MSGMKLTKYDTIVLQGLCQYPDHNDSDLSRVTGVKQTTVTNCRNRMRKKKKIYMKHYIPAYQRLGYPLVSFSRARWKIISERDMKSIEDKKGEGTVIPFSIRDPVNGFVMAYHRNYSSYIGYTRLFDQGWNHEIHTLEGARKVVNFNFTNSINRIYFPEDVVHFRPEVQHVRPYKFVNVYHERTFPTLLEHPEIYSKEVGKKADVTRQTVVKVRKTLTKEGVIERNSIVDLEKIGMNILSVLIFKSDASLSKLVPKVEKVLGPFYYWVFEEQNHVIIFANTDYSSMIRSMADIFKRKIKPPEVQQIDVSEAESKYCFKLDCGP